MGLLGEALYAFRGRRFVEWLFTQRPQIPILFGLAFYSGLYLNYRYDLVARWRGQATYNDYSYVKEAVAREQARRAALSSSPLPIDPPPSPSSSSVSASLSSTGIN